MVFWSGFIKRIKDAVSRKEFNALKRKVDNDVVFKNMKANTTINNTGNTIVSAPIVNLTSKSGDLEFRVNNTSKAITCGGAKIVGVANPTVNNGVATKQYVDTAIQNIPAFDLSNYVKKTNDENTIITAPIVNLTSSNGNIELRATGSIDVGSKKVTSVATPTEDNDAVNKRYSDAQNATTSARVDAVSTRLTVVDNKATDAGNQANANRNSIASLESNTVKVNGDQTIHGNKSFYRPLNMTGERIFNVGNPTQGSDAVTLSYANSNYVREGNNYIRKQQRVQAQVSAWKEVSRDLWWYRFSFPTSLDDVYGVFSVVIGPHVFTPTRISPRTVELITDISWAGDYRTEITVNWLPQRTY